MSSTFDGWSICRVSCTCTHEDGLVVLFDPTKTSSNAIRCVGPYQRYESLVPVTRILDLMAFLTIAIERQPWAENGYVVWGLDDRLHHRGDSDTKDSGSLFCFVPNLTLRWSLLMRIFDPCDHKFLQRDWHPDDSKLDATHRSGVVLHYGKWHDGLIFDPSLHLTERHDKDLLVRFDLESATQAIANALSHLFENQVLTRRKLVHDTSVPLWF